MFSMPFLFFLEKLTFPPNFYLNPRHSTEMKLKYNMSVSLWQQIKQEPFWRVWNSWREMGMRNAVWISSYSFLVRAIRGFVREYRRREIRSAPPVHLLSVTEFMDVPANIVLFSLVPNRGVWLYFTALNMNLRELLHPPESYHNQWAGVRAAALRAHRS